MATIKGIFEPFYSYVQKQLNIRRWIMSNVKAELTDDEGTLNLMEDPFSNMNRFDNELMVWGEDEDEGFREYTSEELEDKNLKNINHIPVDSFYKLTVEKQAVIRMSSGVDMRYDNNIFEKDTSEPLYVGSGMALRWILSGEGYIGGPNSFYPAEITGNEGQSPEGIDIRSDAKDGYGHVPRPGIKDATINTKSEDGSLREATVNFVAHNRRQLQVLEALYMRPGYPILLEWGWVPYINNDNEVVKTGFSVLEEFFDKSQTFDGLNFAIKDQKIKSCGNYDGFVGFCKNFHFKAREDGGYDCTTEIIAQGEILESLKTSTKVLPKLSETSDYEFDEESAPYKITEIKETMDEFLWVLKG